MTEEQEKKVREALGQIVPFAEQKRRMPWQYTIWHPGCSDELEAYVEWSESRHVSAKDLSDTMLFAIWDGLMADHISLDVITGKALEVEVARRKVELAARN